MSGSGPHLVMNKAECVGTNSVHVVRLKNGISTERLLQSWQNPLTKLSCEIEGHPLGGGLLKGTSKNTVSGGQVVNQGEFLLSQHASPKLCTLVQGFSCYTGMLQLANE